MKTRSLFYVVILLLSFILVACGGSGAAVGAPDAAAALDHSGLLDALKAGGSAVEELGEIEQPFFSVPGQRVAIGDAEIQVFEFADEAAAAEAAASISPDGGEIGLSMVSWIESPHFFESGKLIVLYVGENAQVTGLLEGLLGAQIAGR